jgi:hypothetical protein
MIYSQLGKRKEFESHSLQDDFLLNEIAANLPENPMKKKLKVKTWKRNPKLKSVMQKSQSSELSSPEHPFNVIGASENNNQLMQVDINETNNTNIYNTIYKCDIENADMASNKQVNIDEEEKTDEDNNKGENADFEIPTRKWTNSEMKSLCETMEKFIHDPVKYNITFKHGLTKKIWNALKKHMPSRRSAKAIKDRFMRQSKDENSEWYNKFQLLKNEIKQIQYRYAASSTEMQLEQFVEQQNEKKKN